MPLILSPLHLILLLVIFDFKSDPLLCDSGSLGVIMESALGAWQLRFAPIITPPGGNVCWLFTTSPALCMKRTHRQGTHYLDSGYMLAKEWGTLGNMPTLLTRQPSTIPFSRSSLPAIAGQGRKPKTYSKATNGG